MRFSLGIDSYAPQAWVAYLQGKNEEEVENSKSMFGTSWELLRQYGGLVEVSEDDDEFQELRSLLIAAARRDMPNHPSSEQTQPPQQRRYESYEMDDQLYEETDQSYEGTDQPYEQIDRAGSRNSARFNAEPVTGYVGHPPSPTSSDEMISENQVRDTAQPRHRIAVPGDSPPAPPRTIRQRAAGIFSRKRPVPPKVPIPPPLAEDSNVLKKAVSKLSLRSRRKASETVRKDAAAEQAARLARRVQDEKDLKASYAKANTWYRSGPFKRLFGSNMNPLKAFWEKEVKGAADRGDKAGFEDARRRMEEAISALEGRTVNIPG